MAETSRSLGLQADVPLRRLFALAYLVAQIATLSLAGFGIYWLVASYLWSASIERTQEDVFSGWHHRPSFLREQAPPPSDWVPGNPSTPVPLETLMPRYAENQSNRHGGFARIFSPNGAVLASTGALEVPAPSPQELQQLASDVAAGDPHVLASRWENHSTRYQVLLIPLADAAPLRLVLQLAVDWTSAENLLRALAGFLVGIGLAALLLSLAVAHWLSRRLSQPLERLAGTALELASGNLSARTRLPAGRNEVFAVATAFDAMAEKLQQAFVAQKRFVADASHELKTPLTSIGGMAEMLVDGVDDDDPHQRDLALSTISKEVERMDAIVSDLLILSQAEQSRPRPVETVDVAVLTRQLADQYSLQHPAHVWSVRVDGPCWTLGSTEEVTRVVRNLVDNAVKYTSVGGRITVQCEVSGDHVRVGVEDTGIGISEADLKHVLEPFYRADRSRARKTGGSGLGLSIVKTVVERLGGTLKLTSTPNVGTRIEVRLPKTGSPAQAVTPGHVSA